MFVMFGWVKDAKALDASVRCYCYRCQRTRSWEAWKETEWVSFFMVKTIPFLSKTHIVCAACREAFALDARRARQLGIAAELPLFVGHLERLQLAGKSAVQRGFLQAQREQRETVE
ncbi:MAG: hypothetical protein ABJD97_10330 [Betaproteobacteria bacterium]